jgi:hypothetical protein
MCFGRSAHSIVYYKAGSHCISFQQLHRARGAVEAKIAEIDQQMMMETKMRQKSQRFHRKMMESGKSSKGGERLLMSVVLRPGFQKGRDIKAS